MYLKVVYINDITKANSTIGYAFSDKDRVDLDFDK